MAITSVRSTATEEANLDESPINDNPDYTVEADVFKYSHSNYSSAPEIKNNYGFRGCEFDIDDELSHHI